MQTSDTAEHEANVSRFP